MTSLKYPEQYPAYVQSGCFYTWNKFGSEFGHGKSNLNFIL